MRLELATHETLQLMKDIQRDNTILLVAEDGHRAVEHLRSVTLWDFRYTDCIKVN